MKRNLNQYDPQSLSKSKFYLNYKFIEPQYTNSDFFMAPNYYKFCKRHYKDTRDNSLLRSCQLELSQMGYLDIQQKQNSPYNQELLQLLPIQQFDQQHYQQQYHFLMQSQQIGRKNALESTRCPLINEMKQQFTTSFYEMQLLQNQHNLNIKYRKRRYSKPSCEMFSQKDVHNQLNKCEIEFKSNINPETQSPTPLQNSFFNINTANKRQNNTIVKKIVQGNTSNCNTGRYLTPPKDNPQQQNNEEINAMQNKHLEEVQNTSRDRTGKIIQPLNLISTKVNRILPLKYVFLIDQIATQEDFLKHYVVIDLDPFILSCFRKVVVDLLDKEMLEIINEGFQEIITTNYFTNLDQAIKKYKFPENPTKNYLQDILIKYKSNDLQSRKFYEFLHYYFIPSNNYRQQLYSQICSNIKKEVANKFYKDEKSEEIPFKVNIIMDVNGNEIKDFIQFPLLSKALLVSQSRVDFANIKQIYQDFEENQWKQTFRQKLGQRFSKVCKTQQCDENSPYSSPRGLRASVAPTQNMSMIKSSLATNKRTPKLGRLSCSTNKSRTKVLSDQSTYLPSFQVTNQNQFYYFLLQKSNQLDQQKNNSKILNKQ